jgi:hypothetical protein
MAAVNSSDPTSPVGGAGAGSGGGVEGEGGDGEFADLGGHSRWRILPASPHRSAAPELEETVALMVRVVMETLSI